MSGLIESARRAIKETIGFWVLEDEFRDIEDGINILAVGRTDLEISEAEKRIKARFQDEAIQKLVIKMQK